MGQFRHQWNKRNMLLFCVGLEKKGDSHSSQRSLSFSVAHSSWGHDLLSHQLWHSRPMNQTPTALWRRAGRLLSLYEFRWVPMCPPHFFTAVRGRIVAFGCVATFVLGYTWSHWVAGLSTLTPSQSFSVLLTPPTPPFPPLSLLLWVSYSTKKNPLDSWDKEVCTLKYSEQSSFWMHLLHFALTQCVNTNPWSIYRHNSFQKSKMLQKYSMGGKKKLSLDTNWTGKKRSGLALKISVWAVYQAYSRIWRVTVFFSPPFWLIILPPSWPHDSMVWWFPPLCHSRQEMRDNGISLYHRPGVGMHWCLTTAAVSETQ